MAFSSVQYWNGFYKPSCMYKWYVEVSQAVDIIVFLHSNWLARLFLACLSGSLGRMLWLESVWLQNLFHTHCNVWKCFRMHTGNKNLPLSHLCLSLRWEIILRKKRESVNHNCIFELFVIILILCGWIS